MHNTIRRTTSKQASSKYQRHDNRKCNKRFKISTLRAWYYDSKYPIYHKSGTKTNSKKYLNSTGWFKSKSDTLNGCTTKTMHFWSYFSQNAFKNSSLINIHKLVTLFSFFSVKYSTNFTNKGSQVLIFGITAIWRN